MNNLLAKNPVSGRYYNGYGFAADRAGALPMSPNTKAEDFRFSWDCPVEMEPAAKAPLVVSYGLGVDSTAMLVGFAARGIRPDLILFADTGAEKPGTYAYLEIINEWLKKVNFPPVIVVRYEPKNFRNWPPYSTLEENCLTNGTLPSLAFGFKSCSLKWKVAPQDEFVKAWAPAKDAWENGLKVRKAIGFDASPADTKRYAHSATLVGKDELFAYEYPLRDWGWTREICKAEIAAAGLPVPPKSACFFCPATKPAELHEMDANLLERIVRLEARAAPRLEGLMDKDGLAKAHEGRMVKYEAKVAKWHKACAAATAKGGAVSLPPAPKMPKMPKVGDGCSGLWRSATKARPAMMTDYIKSAGLLPAERIAEIWAETPKEIVAFLDGFARAKAAGVEDAFMAEHALDDYREGSGINLNFCPLGRIGGEEMEGAAA